MCRNRRSLPLIGYEIADRSVGDNALLGTFPFRCVSGGDQAFCDQTIDLSWLIERHEPGDGLAVVGHRDLVTVANYLQILAQMVSQLAHSCFHLSSMALFS